MPLVLHNWTIDFDSPAASGLKALPALVPTVPGLVPMTPERISMVLELFPKVPGRNSKAMALRPGLMGLGSKAPGTLPKVLEFISMTLESSPGTMKLSLFGHLRGSQRPDFPA